MAEVADRQVSIRLPSQSDIKPYPEYKDSGVRWLGNIPSHWEVQPGFSAYRPKQDKNTGLIENTVLSLSYGRIIIKPPEKLHGLVPASFETYQIINPGEIIIRPTDLQNDKVSLRVGIARDRGIITSAYLCLKTTERLTPEYGYLLLHAYDLKKVFYGMGSGLRQNLDYSDIKRMPVLVPPKNEQIAITNYLSQLDHRINRLIRAKRRLIDLLTEQKQAIIHRAVTRGLNRNVSLKPSRIDWLGDIPEHWEIQRIKQITFLKSGENITSLDITDKGDFPVFGGNGIRGFTSSYTHEGEYVLIGRQGALCGNINYAKGKFWASEHAVVANPLIKYRLVWFGELLRTMNLNQYSISAAQPGLAVDRIKNLKIPLPKFPEQIAISNYIEENTRELDHLISRSQQEISLLREYQTRLIADVVTGKLDVRGSKLPAFDEPELVEEDGQCDENDFEEIEMLNDAMVNES